MPHKNYTASRNCRAF